MEVVAKYKNMLINFTYILFILLFLYGVNKSIQAKIYINELSKFNSFSTYQIQGNYSKTGVRLDAGKLGNFYTCLKSYKPLGWGSPKEGDASTVKIRIGNSYLLSMGVAGDAVYRFSLYKVDSENSVEWNSNSYAVNCDLNLLSEFKEHSNTKLLDQLSSKKAYKELFTSNPELSLSKNLGRLGLFHSCLIKNKPWNEKTSIIDEGMVKLDLLGYILHLGVVGNKAVNFSIERYGLKRETLALSKTYQVDCNLNLLNS